MFTFLISLFLFLVFRGIKLEFFLDRSHLLLLLYSSTPLLNNRTDLDWGVASSVMAEFLLEDLSLSYPIL